MLDRHQLTSDLLADYALGFLTPDETAEVEAALDLYPEARDEVNRYLASLTDLVMELEPSPVPEGAEDRLLHRLNAEGLGAGLVQPKPVQPDLPLVPAPPILTAQGAAVQDSPSARRNWLLPLLAVAAAVGIGAVVLPNLNRSGGDFARYQAQQGAVSTPVKNKAGTTLANVVRLPDGQTYVQMAATVPSGRAYQAWKIEDGKPVSLGMFRGREYGAQLPAGTVFAVTVEPEGGSPQPTTAPLFAQPI